MIGNYPVNDDWIFYRQIEAFNQGIWALSSKIDPSFIAQGLIGYLWSKIFGLNFINLQILTLLITILGSVAFIKILKTLNIPKNIRILCLLLFLFNPLIFTSSFSFMTDNYFLAFSSISIYFFLSHILNNRGHINIYLGSFFMFLAVLTRQIGIFIGLSFIISKLLDKKKDLLSKIKEALVPAFSIIFSLIINYIWPKYDGGRVWVLAEQISLRVENIFLSIHYLPFFIFPLFLGLIDEKKSLKELVFLLISMLSISSFLINVDLFPAGNVFYIEELYAKSDFRQNFSLFDSVMFKTFLSLLISYSFSILIIFLGKKIKKITAENKKLTITQKQEDIFLLFHFFFNYSVLLISSDYYDRYLLPSFLSFFLLFLKKLYKDIRLNIYLCLCTLLFIFISISLQWDFSSKNRLLWKQAHTLSKDTGLTTQIDVNDIYTKYMNSVKENDFSGKSSSGEFIKKCFVQKYSTDSDSFFWTKVEEFENIVNERVGIKRKPYGSLKREGISRANKNRDKFLYNEEYTSILFNIVGKKTYVASWCIQET